MESTTMTVQRPKAEAKSSPRPTNFTIEHILQHAGCPRASPPPNSHRSRAPPVPSPQQTLQIFDWLHCTRYRPPKLKRSKKKEGCVRRKLGRNPRIPFSAAQVAVLEDKFRASPYLSTSDVGHLSTLLRLSDTREKQSTAVLEDSKTGAAQGRNDGRL